ncbi:DNA polymerase [Pseudomonadota bacterium]
MGEVQLLHRVTTRLGLVREFKTQGAGFLKGEAQNIPVQGSAAEVMLVTIGRLPAGLKGINTRLYHNIHDELVVETSEPGAAGKALGEAMKERFLEVFPEGEPIAHDLVDVRIGRNRAEVH